MLNIQKSTIKIDEKTKANMSLLKKKIEFLSSEIERLENVKKNHEKDVSMIKSLDSKIEELQDSITMYNKEIEEKDRELNRLEDSVLSTESTLSKLREEEDKKLDSLNILDNKISRISEEIQCREITRSWLEKEIANLMESKDTLSNDIKKLEEIAKQLSVDSHEVMWINASVSKRIKEKHEYLKKLKSDISSIERDIDWKKLDYANIEKMVWELSVQSKKIIDDAKKYSETLIAEANDNYSKIINNAKNTANNELNKNNELFAKRESIIREKQIDLDKIDWALSDKNRWLDEKERKLKAVKSQLESFYWKKIDNIVL